MSNDKIDSGGTPLPSIKLINERAPLYKLYKKFESRNKSAVIFVTISES